jgi:hypothetical protein
MEHSDFAPAVTCSLPAHDSLAGRSPHRRIWRSSLALGFIGCLLALWGKPATEAGSDANEPAAAPVADAAAFASGCQRGDAVACNDLGVTALHSVPSDPRLAARSFERACENGSADGCSNLGALYEAGVGVRASSSDAADLYERACTGGAALGCSNLGALYARGKGVVRDESEAQRLFSEACASGSAAGCNNLMRVGAR